MQGLHSLRNSPKRGTSTRGDTSESPAAKATPKLVASVAKLLAGQYMNDLHCRGETLARPRRGQDPFLAVTAAEHAQFLAYVPQSHQFYICIIANMQDFHLLARPPLLLHQSHAGGTILGV
jgi:hypothetical protein